MCLESDAPVIATHPPQNLPPVSELFIKSTHRRSGYFKQALSTTALSVRLAAIGTLLATAAWAPAAVTANGQADRALSAKDNCTVRAVMPTSSSTELPWFLRATAPVDSKAAATAHHEANENARATAN